MKCPKCGQPTYVTDSRLRGETIIRRRRECRVCRHRLTSYELPLSEAAAVAFSDGIKGASVQAMLEQSTDDQLMAEIKRRWTALRKAVQGFKERETSEDPIVNPFMENGEMIGGMTTPSDKNGIPLDGLL